MDTIIYDIETLPNCFTLAAEHADYPMKWSFEISDYRNDSEALYEWLNWLQKSGTRMVGFNNIGFDYPVLHMFIQMRRATAQTLYEKAQAIIKSRDDDDRFSHMVYPSDRYIEQLDLYRIHHFDNKARSTSLKALEFSMRADNIKDLPFDYRATLNQEQIKVLHAYNAHDVTMTKQFYHKSLKMIRFREELTAKHGRDFMNHSDVKIGKEIFQMELEKSGVQTYVYGQDGRKPRQTKRDSIRLADCIPSWVRFTNPEFQRIKDWFSQQVITETKGAFKDVVARVGGLDFYFGTGGIHASVDNEYVVADDEMMILDVDVTSLYPSIAIVNGYYPEHLGPEFVQVYARLKEQRVGYAKGTAENAMLKLALNGVYGASGDKFSIFYDPLFTMRITIGGQLMLAMLAEQLLETPNLRIIQANTDGITMHFPRSMEWMVTEITQRWEAQTKLELERVEYGKMIIADVNSYIAVSTNGKVKRKGRYEYVLDWHKNASALVVPKVAEQVLVYGKPMRETLENWPDRMDFMCRVKVPRGSRLELADGTRLENIQRYYVAKGGQQLVKIMPPLKGKSDERRFNIESGWGVCTCNDIKDAVLPIDYDYYINEVEKLTLGVM